ncbi:prepronociceptin [Alosa sapidissima]|uniref:prepronociceptin n=1 Tax=Alosa sapidissima TaxID=34773 RepID=UPI001C08EBD3|nr:prepronociceptin [Alosa sapidissima]
MKTPLWILVFLGLFAPGYSDCQGDCLSCLELLPKDQAFNTLVCLVECHGNVSPGLNWEMCRKVVEKPQVPSQSLGGAMLKRSQEDVASLLPLEQEDGGLPYSGALQRFDHVARALGLGQQGVRSRTTQLAPETVEGNQEDEDEEEEEEAEEDRDEGDGVAINLTKRFGGFLKGKYGYKKLMNPGRSYQKRYGGFIGVRKSARKWNNQKRFSEFLKQYLGMSTRSSEYKSVSADLTQQNEV